MAKIVHRNVAEDGCGIEARGLYQPDSRPGEAVCAKKKDVKGNEPKLGRKQRTTRGTNPIEPINEPIEE